MNKTSVPHRLNFSAYDFFILTITGLSLIALLVIALPFFDQHAKQIAFSLDTFLSLLFLVDFFFILINSSDKRAYLKWGWIDFFGSLPYLPLLRILRIFRAIRSIRILRNNRFQDIWQGIKKQPERTTFIFVILFAIFLVVFSSYTILLIEQNSSEQNIKTAGDAIWWSIVTITTVGYGDHYPTTVNGRIMAALLMFVGIGLFSSLTSYLSTSFISRRQRKEGKSTNQVYAAEIDARLSAIEEQLKDLNGSIQKISAREDE